MSHPLDRPLRLTRLRRVFVHEPLYFVTFCSQARRHLLDRAAVHQTFRQFARNALNCGVAVGRHVLMPDHAHLFAQQGRDGLALSVWIKSLRNSLSKTPREERIGPPHWQKGFFDHVMRSAESYSEKWDYVCNNPARAGLVERSEDWKYQGVIHDMAF
ncbi:MAG TPA: transposase [Opitutus sp.]|nr:transposase [Opitutus sp.]